MGRGVNQALIRSSAEFFLKILMQNDLPRMDSIEVEIYMVPNMVADLHNTAVSGWLDHRQRPNKFFVEMDQDNGYKTSLIGLGHELTHVKQMAFGERQESWDGQTIRWFGQTYDLSVVHYYDLPWEIEALGREFGLYHRYVESLQNREAAPTIVIAENKFRSVA